MADTSRPLSKLIGGSDAILTRYHDNEDGTYSPQIHIPAGDANIGNVDLASAIPAGEAHVGQVGGHSDIIQVTLSLDTNAYADGDVLAATQAAANVVRVSGGTAILDMVRLQDDDKQAGALDILLFRSDVNIGAENGAYDITDAEMLELLGWVRFVAGDYTTWTNQCTASIKRGDSAFKASILKPTTGTSIYVAAISRDAKTYSASGITLFLHVLQD